MQTDRPRIPLCRPELGGNEARYLAEAIAAGELTHHGRFLTEFERSLSRALGPCHDRIAACSSGTAALHLALLAAGIGPGDEVLVPDLTFAAPAAVVRHVSATPVLVDVEPDTWGMDPNAIESALTPRTKAIIAAHLFGMPAKTLTAAMIADLYGLALIEDCAEAFDLPLSNNAKRRFACFSFYANKHITTGEGGAVLSRDERDLERVRLFRDGGFVPGTGAYFHTVAGLNYRMTNLQAAVGCAQLERWPEFRDRRDAVVRRYAAALDGKGSWFFCARVREPEHARRALAADGIETRAMFTPLHRMPPYVSDRRFPIADSIAATHICLPTGPHLSQRDVDYVIGRVRGLQ